MSQPVLLPDKQTPSKLGVVILNAFPLSNILGLDRMYAGCGRTGFYKFLLFVGSFFLMSIQPQLGVIALLASLLWALIDWIRVSINALSRSYYRVFCKTHMTWSSNSDIRWAFWVSLFLSGSGMFALMTALISTLLVGFEELWDWGREKTGMEKYIASGASIKEHMNLRKTK